MNTESALLVVLSITLSVFLVVAIFLTIMLIRVVRNVHHVTRRAEEIASHVAGVTRAMKDSVKPAAITAIVVKAIKQVLGDKPKGRKNG